MEFSDGSGKYVEACFAPADVLAMLKVLDYSACTSRASFSATPCISYLDDLSPYDFQNPDGPGLFYDRKKIAEGFHRYKFITIIVNGFLVTKHVRRGFCNSDIMMSFEDVQNSADAIRVKKEKTKVYLRGHPLVDEAYGYLTKSKKCRLL
jgi:hypothetical protein